MNTDARYLSVFFGQHTADLGALAHRRAFYVVLLLACHPHMQSHVRMTGTYNYWMVALSLLIAMCASYAALDLAGRTAAARGAMRFAWLLGGAASMGLGIWSMHYIGMDAMRLAAHMHWDVPIIIVSVVIAIAVSLVALWLAFRFRAETRELAPLKFASAAVMGVAVVAMHYTGMAAATFVPADVPAGGLPGTNISSLASQALTCLRV